MISSKFSKSFQGGNVILPYDIYNVRGIPYQKSLKTISIISEVRTDTMKVSLEFNNFYGRYFHVLQVLELRKHSMPTHWNIGPRHEE